VRDLDTRALARAVVAGSINAALVAIVSIVGSFPRVWPGTVLALVVTTASFYALCYRPASRR
jgi:hypothetical protein